MQLAVVWWCCALVYFYQYQNPIANENKCFNSTVNLVLGPMTRNGKEAELIMVWLNRWKELSNHELHTSGAAKTKQYQLNIPLEASVRSKLERLVREDTSPEAESIYKECMQSVPTIPCRQRKSEDHSGAARLLWWEGHALRRAP